MNTNLSHIDSSYTVEDRLEVKPMRMKFMSSKSIKYSENKRLNNSFLTSIKMRENNISIDFEKSKNSYGQIIFNKSADKKDFTFRPTDDKVYKYDKKIIKNKILPIRIIDSKKPTFMKIIKINENDEKIYKKDSKNDISYLHSASSTIYDTTRKSKDSPKIMKRHPGLKKFFD